MDTDLRALVGETELVDPEQPVAFVHDRLVERNCKFLAVGRHGRAIGVCGLRELGLLLGSRYGFALYARKPIARHLLAEPVRVRVGTPIAEVFQTAFRRTGEAFFDDVILDDEAGCCVGLIPVRTLVALQNHQHLDNIHRLEAQRLEILRRNREIEADLRLGRQLQQALLAAGHPSFPPASAPNSSLLRFHHRYVPSGMVGGDFFHIAAVSDWCAGVLLCDVMGHGVRAALITAMIRAFLAEPGLIGLDPGVLLQRINRRLIELFEQIDGEVMFVTAVAVQIDAAARHLRFATAGHPPLLHLRRQRQSVEAVDHAKPGVPLGLFADSRYLSEERALQSDDTVLILTDGLLDAEGGDGEEFGLDGVVQSLLQRLHEDEPALLDGLLQDARTHRAVAPFSDDVCLLAVRHASADAGAVRLLPAQDRRRLAHEAGERRVRRDRSPPRQR